MFLALCKRRNVHIRYQRFANAMTASAVYNVNRSSAEDPVIRPFDFVMDEEQSERRERQMYVRRVVRDSVRSVNMGASREKYLQVRKTVIEKLNAAGYPEAEQVFDEMWPHLKPKGRRIAECQKSAP